jgi:tetratricopeptide (TPR) repeat protein
MYAAMESKHHDPDQAAKMCRQALEIYPDCVDAIHMLADIESRWQRDFKVGLEKAIEAGRRDLGEPFFRENEGCFWGLIETRPFMRAMGAYAQVLAENEFSQDEAISVHEEMLRLNPNDNQGMRYGLLGCYLARKQYRDARMLLDEYDEDSAIFLWGEVLLHFATKDEGMAMQSLKLARQANPHVEKYFFPRKQMPKERLGYYQPGDETEAIMCAQLLHNAWKAHSPARKWLEQACRDDSVPSTHENSQSQKKQSQATSKPQSPSSRGTVDEQLSDMLDDVPNAYAARFSELVKLTDGFCDAHLNAEYKELCREMAVAVCQNDSPVLKGKAESWAAGIVYSLGRINFLTDPSQTPHMKSKQIAEGFSVSVGTMQAKSKVIREGLDLFPFHPDWCLSSLQESNPLTWMMEVNGFIMDIRTAPRDAQVAAYEEGLIPYIPADRNE